MIGFLRAPCLKTIEVESRPQAIAQIELLADADVRSRTHQQTDRSRRVSAAIDLPGGGEIGPSTGLNVAHAFRGDGDVLDEERVGRADLKLRGLVDPIREPLKWLNHHSEEVRLENRVCWYLR